MGLTRSCNSIQFLRRSISFRYFHRISFQIMCSYRGIDLLDGWMDGWMIRSDVNVFLVQASFHIMLFRQRFYGVFRSEPSSGGYEFGYSIRLYAHSWLSQSIRSIRSHIFDFDLIRPSTTVQQRMTCRISRPCRTASSTISYDWYVIVMCVSSRLVLTIHCHRNTCWADYVLFHTVSVPNTILSYPTTAWV